LNGLNGTGSDAHTEGSDLLPVSAPAAPSGAPAQVPPSQVRPAPVRSAPMAPATATVDRPLEPAHAPEHAETASQPEIHPEIDAPAPMAGFVAELPQPQQAETPALIIPGLYFSVVVRPEQPRHEPAVAPRASEPGSEPGSQHSSATDEAPVWAGAVALAIPAHSSDFGPAIRSSGVEVRESARMTPVTTPAAVMELHTCGPGGGQPGSSVSDGADPQWARRNHPLGFSIPPVAPGPITAPWMEAAQEFDPLPIELGDLARLAFSTEGFTETPIAGDPLPPPLPAHAPAATPAPPSTSALSALAPSALAPSNTEESEPQRAPSAPMSIERQRHEPSSAVRAEVEPVRAAGVQIDRAFLQSLTSLELTPAQTALPTPAGEPTVPQDAARAGAPAEITPPASAAPEFPVPERVTRPLPLTLHGFPPGRGKAAQIYSAALRAVPEIQIPSTGALPLRPVMVFGPALAAPAASAVASPAPSSPGTPAPAGDDKIKSARTPAPGAAAEETAKARIDSRPTLRKPLRPGERVSEAVKPDAAKPDAAKLRRIEPSAAADVSAGKPIPSPAAKLAKVEAADPKLAAKTDRKPESKTEIKPESKPEPKSEVKSAPKPEPKRGVAPPAPAQPADSFDLGLPSLQVDGGSKSRMPAPAVLVAVLAVAGAIGAGVYLMGGKSTKPAPVVSGAPVSDVVEAGTLSVGEAGWIEDWAPQPPNPKVLRVLSILRGSLPLSDYRMEFEAQIESKALGWVYRALNPKNYYVTKLEIVKPGIEPTVEVAHFAMIDGEEQTRSHTPLTVKVRVDTSYKVRFEALGDRFTTYVEGQKVDEWTDNRIGRGGVGMYRERGESALLKGTVRMTLIAKKK